MGPAVAIDGVGVVAVPFTGTVDCGAPVSPGIGLHSTAGRSERAESGFDRGRRAVPDGERSVRAAVCWGRATTKK